MKINRLTLPPCRATIDRFQEGEVVGSGGADEHEQSFNLEIRQPLLSAFQDFRGDLIVVDVLLPWQMERRRRMCLQRVQWQGRDNLLPHCEPLSTVKRQTPLTCGNTVPEEGLKLYSRPCNTGNPRKHVESEAIRSR
jgi:hypothetical protein